MSNYELYLDKLTSMIDISDLEYVVKALKDQSDPIEADISRMAATKTLEEILRRMQTDKKCPRCGKTLCLSDLPEYDYLCTDCQENFFEVEVK